MRIKFDDIEVLHIENQCIITNNELGWRHGEGYNVVNGEIDEYDKVTLGEDLELQQDTDELGRNIQGLSVEIHPNEKLIYIANNSISVEAELVNKLIIITNENKEITLTKILAAIHSVGICCDSVWQKHEEVYMDSLNINVIYFTKHGSKSNFIIEMRI